MRKINKQKLSSQAGFTLIELVVVIVILGILAATAAPKFIDLQGDARAATVQALKAAMESSNTLVHSKSLIAGNDRASGSQTVAVYGSTSVNIVNGWPTNENIDTWALLLDINANEFTLLSDGAAASGSAEIYAFPTDATLTTKALVTAANCYALFIESGSTDTKPSITTVTTGC